MYLHVDLTARRVVPWLPEARERLDAATAAHARLARPNWAGRRIAMPT
jgi:acyl-CoA thioester hydrolase